MTKSSFLAVFALVFLVGCESKPKINYDASKLIKEKCSSCHNLDLPPKTYENEVAPPMMAVAFHIKDFIKVNDESARVPKAVEFVKDYVINPSASKSFCDKQSLESYGVMPSQKGKVTEGELDAIAKYMFENFTVEKLQEAQAIEAKLKKMPKGKRIAIRNNCLTCHKIDKTIVGPSFRLIAKKYKENIDAIKNGIKNGSAKKYLSSHGAVMPKFKDKIDDEDIDTLSRWIANL